MVLITDLTRIVQCVEMWQIGIYNTFREQIQLLIYIEKGWTNEYVGDSTYEQWKLLLIIPEIIVQHQC